MLPVLAVLNLAFAVLIRRRFGLFSGVYDVLMGLMRAVLQYSALGIPTSLTKLLPDVGATRGASGLRRFLWRAALVRLLALGVCLVALQTFGGVLVVQLQLGANGALYLQLVTGLMVARAVIDLAAKVLNTFFAQMWTNGLALLQAALDIVLAAAALFAIAFRLSMMSVGLVVAGFRGLYRPLFARLRLRDDLGQLRHAFTIVTKAQLVLLLPAGIGLIVMCGDYIPLLFGAEFLHAVQISWVLVAFMYAETAFNLPVIILSVDEQYRAVFVSQSVMILAAPLFVVAAATVGLVGAGAVFGTARLASALCAYAYCRARYGLRFPWSFAGRVARVSLVMGGLLAFARSVLATSVLETVGLTVLGVVVFAVGVRITRVLTTEEADVFRRSSVPGSAVMLDVLAPHLATGADD